MVNHSDERHASSGRRKLFISYSHHDAQWKDMLVDQLRVLGMGDDQFEYWEDGELEIGDLWRQKLQEALDGAGILVLLVSEKSLGSKFVLEQELRPFRNRPGTLICPLIVSSTNWKLVEEIKHLQAFPRDTSLDLLTTPEARRLLTVFAGDLWAKVQADSEAPARGSGDAFSDAAIETLPFKADELARSAGDYDAIWRERERSHEEPAPLLLGSTLETAPEAIRGVIRLCAVPRVFDGDLLGVLRGSHDRQENARLLAALVGQSFVRPDRRGGYLYDSGVRQELLNSWRSDDAGRSELDRLNRALAEFYWNRFEEEIRRDSDLSSLPGTFIDPYRAPKAAGTPLIAPLPEAIHHQVQRSIDAAYDFFVDKFQQSDDRGQWPTCQALVHVLRRELERYPEVPPEKVRWLSYWDARVRLQLGRYAPAAALLRDLLKDDASPAQLKLWCWGDLGDVLARQRKLADARQAQEAGLTLAQQTRGIPETRGDRYNVPVWYARLADLHAALDEPELAIRGHREALRLAEQASNQAMVASSHVSLSSVLRQSGDWNGAWAAAIEALFVVRTQDVGLSLMEATDLQLASLLAEQSSAALLDTVHAEVNALRASASRGLQLEARKRYVDNLQACGQLDRAMCALAELVRNRDFDLSFDIDLMLAAASLQSEEGRLATAESLYREIADRVRSDPTRVWELAVALYYLARTQAEMPEPDWRSSQNMASEAQRLWSELGYSKLASLAEVHAIRAALHGGDDKKGLQGRLDRAMTELAGTPQHEAEALRAQAELLQALRRPEEAVERYQKASDLYRQAHVTRDAIRCLDSLGALSPEREGEAAKVASQLRAALDAANRYVPSPGRASADADNARGVAALAGKRWGEAKDLFRSAIGAVTEDCWYHLNLAFACQALEHWAEARQALQRSIELIPWSTPRMRRQLETYEVKHIDGLCDRGDALTRQGDHQAAVRELQAALTFIGTIGDDPKLRASVHARLSLAVLAAGDPLDATRALRLSVEQFRRLGDCSPGALLGQTCRPLLHDFAHYLSVETAWRELADQDPGLRAELFDARNELAVFLTGPYQLLPTAYPWMVPLPLALEIGDALIPEDKSVDRWALFTRQIPRLKESIANELGVALPGIRVRPVANPTAPPDRADYVALIDEIPVRRGTVPLGRVFRGGAEGGPSASPESAGLSGRHPLTGDPGVWLPAGDGESAPQADPVASDPLEYVVLDLEAAIRRHLSRFADLAEVARLITTWRGDGGDPGLVEEALARVGGLMGLRTLLLSLVEERVAVKDGRPLLSALRETGQEAAPAAVLRMVRLALKPVLPGNRASDVLHHLPPGWEDRLSGTLQPDGSLALGPEEALDLLRLLRGQSGLDHPRAVVVVRDGRVRPFVRRLVAGELPDLMVLAEEEALPEALRRLDQVGEGPGEPRGSVAGGVDHGVQ